MQNYRELFRILKRGTFVILDLNVLQHITFPYTVI